MDHCQLHQLPAESRGADKMGLLNLVSDRLTNLSIPSLDIHASFLPLHTIYKCQIYVV